MFSDDFRLRVRPASAFAGEMIAPYVGNVDADVPLSGTSEDRGWVGSDGQQD